MGEQERFEHDPDFKGPVENRHCTDKLCLILFVVFWVGMIVVAALGFANGNPLRLYYPSDMYGNVCGLNNIGTYNGVANMEAKKFLYYPDPASNRDLQVCVAACPTKGSLASMLTSQAFGLTGLCNVSIAGVSCPADQIQCTKAAVQALSQAEKCSGTHLGVDCFCPYPTINLLRRCFPDIQKASALVTPTNQTATFQDVAAVVQSTSKIYAVLGDIWNVWWFILLSIGVCAIICFIYLLFLRCAAGIIVWLTVILVVASFWALAGYAYITAIAYQKAVSPACPLADVYFEAIKKANPADAATLTKESICVTGGLLNPEKEGVDMDKVDNAKLALIFSYVMFGVAALVLCLVLFFIRRIKLAIAIVKEAAKALGALKTIIFFPLIVFVFLAVFVIYWIAVAMFLLSSKEYNAATNKFEMNQNLQYATLYHVFGGFWTFNMFSAIIMCTVAGAVGQWYWTFDKSAMQSPVWGAVKRTLRYHLGSLAFGSLILAIVQFLRFMLEQLERQQKAQQGGQQSKVQKWLFCCARCCLCCLERFLRFLNKNAYIMVAIHGYTFCGGAKRAFHLILRNILRVVAVNTVGAFLLFLGKIFIVALTAGFAMIVLQMLADNASFNLKYWMLPWIVIIFLAYFVASGFMVLYDLAIDTILLCFLEDSERNDGSPEKPYHMSDSLKAFIDHHTKEKPAEELDGFN